MAPKKENDLWGDLPKGKALRTPVTILKEQADALGRKTDNVLLARVRPVPLGVLARMDFSHGFAPDTVLAFEIVAPALGRYTIRVLDMLYDLKAGNYPLILRDKLASQDYECESPEQFEDALQSILTSEKVRNVIQALLSQSQVVA